jgi:hypothetical protein
MIALVCVPGTDALEPGDFLRQLQIGRSLEVPLIRAGGAQYTLELQAADNIGRFVVTVKFQVLRIKSIITQSKNHRTGFQFRPFGLFIITDGLG